MPPTSPSAGVRSISSSRERLRSWAANSSGPYSTNVPSSTRSARFSRAVRFPSSGAARPPPVARRRGRSRWRSSTARRSARSPPPVCSPALWITAWRRRRGLDAHQQLPLLDRLSDRDLGAPHDPGRSRRGPRAPSSSPPAPRRAWPSRMRSCGLAIATTTPAKGALSRSSADPLTRDHRRTGPGRRCAAQARGTTIPAVSAGEHQEASERREALKEVFARARVCTRCPELASTRKTVVFGAGNADAELMFIGEAPAPARTSRACRSWAGPENCWRACSWRSG